jgi:hypothetical protein
MKQRVAAVTMCYNEKAQLPRWIRHYAAQVGGYDNLFVVDHGSDDGSTHGLGPINVKVLPRDAGKGVYQSWRVKYISDLCSELLNSYEFVIYTDTDELVVPDPERFKNIYAYVSSVGAMKGYAIGFDVLHDLANESDLDWRYITEQRSLVQFVGAVCKPVLVSSPTCWSEGFHGSTQPPAFGDLYLLHLRYADLSNGLCRLQITRAIERPEMVGVPVDHHKIDDDTYRKWIESWLRLPRDAAGIRITNPAVKKYIDGMAFNKNAGGYFGADYSVRSKELFCIDKCFRYSV